MGRRYSSDAGEGGVALLGEPLGDLLAGREAVALAPDRVLVVVAPERNRSGASNSLTLDNPLRARRADNGYTYVEGTPTDCVHLAITGLLEEDPDLVVSGINLLSLKDIRFSIGGAVLRGTGICVPCSRMEEVLGFGGYLALQTPPLITVGVIVSFLVYVRRFFQPIQQLAQLYAQLQSALAGAERIFELVDTGGMGHIDADQLTDHIEDQISQAIDSADGSPGRTNSIRRIRRRVSASSPSDTGPRGSDWSARSFPASPRRYSSVWGWE